MARYEAEANPGEWTWTCTGCGDVSRGDTAAEAQAAFFDHVTATHPGAVVVSVGGSEVP